MAPTPTPAPTPTSRHLHCNTRPRTLTTSMAPRTRRLLLLTVAAWLGVCTSMHVVGARGHLGAFAGRTPCNRAAVPFAERCAVQSFVFAEAARRRGARARFLARAAARSTTCTTAACAAALGQVERWVGRRSYRAPKLALAPSLPRGGGRSGLVVAFCKHVPHRTNDCKGTKDSCNEGAG